MDESGRIILKFSTESEGVSEPRKGPRTQSEGVSVLICQKIDEYYERMDVISESVYRMRDKETGDIVRVKELCDFTSPETVTEVLDSLPRHPCIVEYKEVIKVEGGPVSVVMEYVEYDLNSFLQANKGQCKLKLMMKRLLEGVNCLHDNGVTHWNLEPASILISKDGTQLKICDLELSVFKSKAYAPSVGILSYTLSYTAPEVLALAVDAYSVKMDMWAVGCIMAELITKEVLFDKDREEEDEDDDDINNMKQLKCIYGIISAPTNPFKMKFGPLLTPSGYDLLKRLMKLNPCQRVTAEEALGHSWFGEDD